MSELASQIDAVTKRYAAGIIDFSLPTNYADLKNKRVLVTGGCSGIGEAIVNMFVKAGAHVVIADKNATLGKAFEGKLINAKQSAKYVPVDVTSWSSQAKMLHEALAWLPDNELDTVIASAGVAPPPSDLIPASPDALLAISEMSDEGPPTGINVNLIGTYYTVLLTTKYGMGLHDKTKTSKDKSITLLGSMAGYQGRAPNGDYNASKFGVRGLFQSLRSMSTDSGVRLNMLAPSFIKTPLVAPFETMLDAAGVKFAKVEDCVDAVARVCSDKSISGRSIVVTTAGKQDIRDDMQGHNAADVLLELMQGGHARPV